MITKFATVVYCILVARLGEGITHYYNVQSQLATDVERWLNEQDDPDLDDKFHVCVILATNRVQVMRELCGNVSRRLPDVLTSTSPNMLMANVLREIEKQSVECDPNNVTQRIVL
uniref:Uncharacterized protein n=1 Tax=Romanomermis culicivorax TaxID=13658 RepID=A0A915KIB9_ROMCU